MTTHPFDQQKALKHWSELQRLISVGAFTERSAEHYETGTWPEDGVEESIYKLETLATKHGMYFAWLEAEKRWTLEPRNPRFEQVPDGYLITAADQTVFLTIAESYQLLQELYNNRDKMFALVHDLPSDPWMTEQEETTRIPKSYEEIETEIQEMWLQEIERQD